MQEERYALEKVEDGIYFIIKLDKWGNKMQKVYGTVIVQKENKSPYAYRMHTSDEVSSDEWFRLEREAISDYFMKNRV